MAALRSAIRPFVFAFMAKSSPTFTPWSSYGQVDAALLAIEQRGRDRQVALAGVLVGHALDVPVTPKISWTTTMAPRTGASPSGLAR